MNYCHRNRLSLKEILVIDKMKRIIAVASAAFCLTALSTFAQVKEDFVSSPNNQPGKEYPMVNSEGCVRVKVKAPEALSVKLDIGGVKYDLVKDSEGFWTGESAPQDVGFHYYQLNIDGADVPDPSSLYYYGASRWGSGVDCPAPDQDFYALKNVPQGQIRETYYWSKVNNAMRHCFIYTPAGYDTDINKRYPVLYLQHGGGENEYGWPQQGRTAQIMDNLIAEGKAVPFIIVMDNGTWDMPRPEQRPGGQNPPAGSPNGERPRGPFLLPSNWADNFMNTLLQDIIPMVDANFRTIADKEHRAMAGLSMGGMQTKVITLAHPEVFSSLGIFSGGVITVQDADSAPGFRESNKLVFISFGSRELANRNPAFGGDPKEETAKAAASGLNAHFYVSEGTAHEWQSWRRSLYEFAQLLFR